MLPRQTLEAFDRFLTDRDLRFEAVVIGGTALNLLGIITRPTKDCDILYPELPEEIVAASIAFAAEARRAGDALADDWLNNGPSSLTAHLPAGWQERLEPAFTGSVISLRCLGRIDFLRAKLWALCDRGLDLADCVALAPTGAELEVVRPWLEQQDANLAWPEHVRSTLADLSTRLGHGV